MKGEYHEKTNVDGFGCAVIIQQMISAKLAGVCFSKNPITDHNEIVIEAIEGPGEDLVQKGITPNRWRFSQGNLLEGSKHDKNNELIEQIAADTEKIRKKYKKHVDLEWVFDGDKIYYLQLRSITSKSDLTVYSNKMAQEMLPGQIYPLVWSVNIPMVNGTWIKILSEITGPLDVEPKELSKSFYFRMYFNVAALGAIFKKFGMSFDILPFFLSGDSRDRPSFKPGIKIIRHTFRAIRFVFHKLNFEKTFLKEYSNLEIRCRELDLKIKQEFNQQNYEEIYRDLFKEGQRLSYMNIIVPLLMQMYNKRLTKKLEKLDIDYDRLDFSSDFPELDRYSPHLSIESIHREIMKLPEEVKNQFNSFEEFAVLSETKEITAKIRDFISQFGHFSESGNDFSVKKWEEDPEYVFKMIMDYKPISKKAKLLKFESITQGIKRKRKIRKLYQRAGKYRLYREQISSLFTYGTGLFRPLHLRLGEVFVDKKIINDKMDIFLLSKYEIDEILNGNDDVDPPVLKQQIEDRKNEMKATRDYVLPSAIYGDSAPLLDIGELKNFKGVGTSPGLIKGKARVIRRIEDFKNEFEGDILIIPFSDVAWTPILTRAGGIVSETGGMLSHFSIVARELGIPAVASVENACAINIDEIVTLDGSNGILTIHDHE